MNTILGKSQRQVPPATPEKVKAFLTMISHHIKHLQKKLDNLLKFQNTQDYSLQHDFESHRQCKDLSSSISTLQALFKEFMSSHNGVGFL